MSLFSENGHTGTGRLLPAMSATLTLACLFILSGCSKPMGDSSSAPAANNADVVATVNGVPVDRDEMYTEMEQYVPAQLQGFPQNPMLGYPTGRVALQHLITNELLVQLARLDQVPVTDEELAARYNDVKMVKDAQSTSTFEDLLADQGLTTQQFEYANIAPDVAQYNLLTKGVTASAQELQSYYNAHISDYTEPDRIHIERIVLPDEGTAQEAYLSAMKSGSLDSIIGENIAEPLAGGENGADIAQWINVDSPPKALQPIVALAAATTPGTILKPTKVAGQWWLVRLVDMKSKDVLPYGTVQHIVQWNVETSKASAAGNFQRLQGQIQDMTQQAVINVKEPQYISLVKQLKNPPLTSPIGGPSAPGS